MLSLFVVSALFKRCQMKLSGYPSPRRPTPGRNLDPTAQFAHTGTDSCDENCAHCDSTCRHQLGKLNSTHSGNPCHLDESMYPKVSSNNRMRMKHLTFSHLHQKQCDSRRWIRSRTFFLSDSEISSDLKLTKQESSPRAS